MQKILNRIVLAVAFLPVLACRFVSLALYVLTTPLILFTMWLRAIGKADDRELYEMKAAWLTAVLTPRWVADRTYCRLKIFLA